MAGDVGSTMADGCRKLLKDISQMKVEPDADMGFLVSLETAILGYLKPPVPGQGQGGGGQGGPGGAPQGPPGMGQMAPAMGAVMGGGGGPPMGPPPGGMPGMQMAGGPGPSMMLGPGAGMPNPDEFRRGLGQAAQRGSARQLIHKLVQLNPVTPGF